MSDYDTDSEYDETEEEDYEEEDYEEEDYEAQLEETYYGYEEIHRAAESDSVSRLAEAGGEPSWVSRDEGLYPLGHAAYFSSSQRVFQLLVLRYLQEDWWENSSYFTANEFMCIVRRIVTKFEHPMPIRVFLADSVGKLGSNDDKYPDDPSEWLELPDENEGETLLSLAATYNRNPAFITTLLELGSNLEARSSKGRTPLLEAARYNPNPEVVRTLIDVGADVSAVDVDGKGVKDLLEENTKMRDFEGYAEILEYL